MYWPTQAWIHKGCASNVVANRKPSASNAVRDSSGDRSDVDPVPELGGAGQVDRGVVGAVPKKSGSKQRWSREAYNAYQREYMRKRRG